ncbi:MAG: hypothetical protein HRT44_05620 [Bdellovibrionales bacterium]|nr:hypothetical protein [Bdellovibrionales bacterium]NQZ18722.1 hypothetical protein [Bdellovibrionales bacterium]
MKCIKLIFVTTLLMGCTKGYVLDKTEQLFSATFACPATKDIPAWNEPVTMRKMSGVYVMTSDISERAEKVRGPYRYVSVVMDGEWRPLAYFKDGKRYMTQIKGEVIAENKVKYSYKNEAYVLPDGEKVKADSGHRVIEINSDGDWVRSAEAKNSGVCKRM